MNSPSEPTPPPRSDRDITVPRDPDTDDVSGTQDEYTPSPDTVNIQDEDYARSDKPLPPDSPLTEALQEHPPQGEDQLRTGSAGDAARASKAGITGKAIPPRGNVHN